VLSLVIYNDCTMMHSQQNIKLCSVVQCTGHFYLLVMNYTMATSSVKV